MQTSVRRERRSSLSSSANPSFLFFICSFRRASFVRTTATRDVRPRVDPHLTPRACRSTPARARFVSVFVTTPLLFAMPLLFFLLALVLAPAKALAVGAAAVAARASRDGALCFA